MKEHSAKGAPGSTMAGKLIFTAICHGPLLAQQQEGAH